MQENYLAKWLNGELSEAELSEFKKTDEYASYQKIIEASTFLEAPKFDTEKALIDIKVKQQNNNSVKVVKLSPIKKLMRVAAAIAILITGTYFYMNSLNETITTLYAERTEITLPDNSEVVLNADSKVSYSIKNWDTKRNIDLDGEAYFKVAKGKRFTVATDAGTVSVLGTQFNVTQRDGIFKVTCFEGLVSVLFNNKETKLPAGTSFLVVNGQIKDIKAPNTSEPSWINNESSFKSIPLSYVLNELKRQYNITVETKNINTDKLFTGSFSNTNIDLALKSISVPAQIKFKLEGNKVLFYAEKTH